jgi:hypothetical protein
VKEDSAGVNGIRRMSMYAQRSAHFGKAIDTSQRVKNGSLHTALQCYHGPFLLLRPSITL